MPTSAPNQAIVDIACLDESYQASTWYFVAACLGTQAQMQNLRVLLADVSRVLIDHDIDPWLEFHGYEIFQGEGEWKFLKELHRKRVLVYRLVLQAIVDSGCTIWISGVETVGLKNKYRERAFHPHEVALHNLLDTIDSRHQPQNAQVQVIADNVSEKALREARMAEFKANGTMGTGNLSLRRINMPFTWLASSSHAGLQAVDMALYIYQRHHSRTDTDARASKAVTDLMEVLRPIIRRERLWAP